MHDVMSIARNLHESSTHNNSTYSCWRGFREGIAAYWPGRVQSDARRGIALFSFAKILRSNLTVSSVPFSVLFYRARGIETVTKTSEENRASPCHIPASPCFAKRMRSNVTVHELQKGSYCHILVLSYCPSWNTAFHVSLYSINNSGK